MAKYIISGGSRLSGRVKVSGNKNSILPCLAAALLTDEEIILRNVPKISDVAVFSQILGSLGVQVKEGDGVMSLKCSKEPKNPLPEGLVTMLRASILFIGPLLSRRGQVEFFHPGGDVIGKRSIETHLEGFKKLGYTFKSDDKRYKGIRKERSKNWQVFLEEPSVTATENLILASVLGSSVTVLKNCAIEPHVVDLCHLLIRMGADVEGVGSNTLKIQGVPKLHGADFTIGSDYIEMATYAIAAAVTGGKLEVENCVVGDLEPIVYPLEHAGLRFESRENLTVVSLGPLKALPKLKTNIWPGFPTDLMSAMIVLATQSRGISLLHDWMYETRMFFVDKLISMGANITIADPHRVVVYGPTKLRGRNLESPDIRAGMALVLAALTASGESIINRAELIDRGYENVVEKISSLGGEVKRIE